MPKLMQFQCDCGCGTIRQPSNHWRMVRISRSGWTISEWREEMQDDLDVKYVAGEECAHKMLSQFLSAQGK